MKFTTREDIDAPLQDVFDALSNFDMFERAAMRRGADVVRQDALTGTVQGMQWKVSFPFRGKRRNIDAELVRYESNEAIEAQAIGSGLSSQFKLDFVALSPRTTRIAVALDMKPSTISARLFLQSLRLAKASLNQRFKGSVHKYAKDLETRLNGKPKP